MSRPKSIMCPVVFGLGVQLEKSFGSKWLVNHMHRLGYSVSYDEVLRYKQSAIESNVELTSTVEDGPSFCQWVADNVDHNLVTLTGKGTFHGMGVISVSSLDMIRDLAVTTLKERMKVSESVKGKGIPLVDYHGRSHYGLLNLKFKSIKQLSMVQSNPLEVSYNTIWQCSWFFGASNANWSGYMQSITHNYSYQRKNKVDLFNSTIRL